MTPKRAIRLAAAVLIACLIAGSASLVGVGAQRRTTFDAQAASLQRTWAHDLAVGVPAASITPLRSRLREQRPEDEWWAPVWWTTDGHVLLTGADPRHRHRLRDGHDRPAGQGSARAQRFGSRR